MTNKGIELNKIGKYNESITYFDKALAIDPKNNDAIKGKEQTLVLLNQAASSSS